MPRSFPEFPEFKTGIYKTNNIQLRQGINTKLHKHTYKNIQHHRSIKYNQ